ncbi:MAG: hypothetical protein KAQ62_16975, partial [Cyclobacteriaceae bacterium]|nr:hypothetical protein [Cyclobacteriaceae bacterium]
SPVDENPLSDIDFIADISPGNSSTDVSVFASSAVSFNLPVNKLLELPAGLDDEPDKMRVFRPYIEKFTITNVQSGGNTIVSGMFGFGESNTIANFIFTNHEAFEEYNRYKVQVVVQAFEHFPNGSQVLIKDRGRTWQDTKTIFFTTGARPDVMVDEQIAYSYPISDQAYFLQEETNNSFGLVRNIDRTQEYLFERTIDDVDYDYVARFKPVSGGDPLEGVVNSTSRGITFKLPDLENETYYVVQIVRKPSQTMAEQTSESIGSLTSSSVTGPLQTISKNFNFDDFSVTVKLGNQLPGDYVRSGETLLYHYYFRTSRYNSLREKLADLDFEIEKISSPIELFKLSGDIPEKFEEYEINGYYKGGVKRLEPLLKFVAPFTYNYHTQNVNPKVYEVYWTLNNLKRSDPVL